MSTIIHIPTMFLCTGISTLLVAVALTFLWMWDRREPAIAWWSASLWSVTLGTALLSARVELTPWISIGVGNFFALLGMVLCWVGFMVFCGRKPPLLIAFIGPALWAALYFGVPGFRNDINTRLIYASASYAIYGLMVVHCAWNAWKEERLPSYVATTVFFGLHSLVYLFRIGAAIIDPAEESGGLIHSPWIAIFAVEGFVLTIFSAFAFMALVKERAERRYRLAAEVDGLTQVATRRHFVELTRNVLAGRPKAGSLALLDLDYFKNINDTHGHMAGDQVLRTFARFVTARLQRGMVFGRMGGEEFGLYIPNRNSDEAAKFIEEIRAGVEAMEIRFHGAVIRITCSIGVADIAESGLDFDHLMAGADAALYLAKHEGRNRACFFRPSMRLTPIVEEGRESRLSLSRKRLSRIAVRSRPGGKP